MKKKQGQPKENWKKKYEDLKKNFDRLDKHNDVLYRCFVAVRKLLDSGYDGEFISEATKELFNSIKDIENFEKDLKNDRA